MGATGETSGTFEKSGLIPFTLTERRIDADAANNRAASGGWGLEKNSVVKMFGTDFRPRSICQREISQAM
jgi:hypothetical protein